MLPFGDPDGETMYRIYSVMVATFLGTMGLPHVVVRFYTNPDGRAARRTTLIVLALLGAFYLLPTIYGVLGRIYASDLIAEGRADAVVLELPARMLGGNAGELLSALLTAGAFAAFLSTSSGLTMSIAGVVGQALSRRGVMSNIVGLQVAAVGGVLVPLVLALSADRIPVASSVTFAFALAASTFCPLLVLGIWWRGLTAAGAIAGLIGGGLCAGVAPIITISVHPEGWFGRARRPARRVVRAARVRPDDRRLARHPAHDPGRRLPHDGAPARAGGRRPRSAEPFVARERPFVVARPPHGDIPTSPAAAPLL